MFPVVFWEGTNNEESIRNPVCYLVFFSEVFNNHVWFQASNEYRIEVEIIARFALQKRGSFIYF